MENLLEDIYLFNGLGSDDLAKIEAIAEVKFYASGDWIFKQGDQASSFYIIQHGAVSITQDDEEDSSEHLPVATYGSGSHFGEMALLDNEPRSANAVAASDSHIIRIRFDAIMGLLESDHELAMNVYDSRCRPCLRTLIGRPWRRGGCARGDAGRVATRSLAPPETAMPEPIRADHRQAAARFAGSWWLNGGSPGL